MAENERHDAGESRSDQAPSFVAVIAGASAGAGVVHFAMVLPHTGDGLLDPLGFAAFGWLQVGLAAALMAADASRRLLLASVIGNSAAAALWIWSRTAGLPFGTHAGIAEDAAAVDVIAVSLEVTAIAAAVWVLIAPRRLLMSHLASVVLGVSALALATVGIIVPDTSAHSEHDHHVGDDAASAADDGHDHGVISDAHLVDMARIDEERCDWEINPQAYWDEARALGVDTYSAGAMAVHDTAAVDDAAARGGRGSEELDRLVSLTTRSSSEVIAGNLVAALSDVSDDEYSAWLAWMGANAQGHAHGSGGTSAAPEDTGGHGGHVGPHPWGALTDQGDCEGLSGELAQARDVALQYPTAQDAMDAGWTKVTPYLPGIAAHYMNFRYVDGRFAIGEPEMILYDGEGPDANVVGLSYYIMLDGEAEPTQGFTGTGDHYHRHIGLCVAGSLVVGDSTTTDAECAALAGVKQGGSAGWMNHVWVVPGCESPWGVFSGANPLLDAHVAESSGRGRGGCAASGARDRYDLAPGEAPEDSGAGDSEGALAEG